MVEGHSMGFWVAFAVGCGILSVVGVIVLLTMIVSGIAELREWALRRQRDGRDV